MRLFQNKDLTLNQRHVKNNHKTFKITRGKHSKKNRERSSKQFYAYINNRKPTKVQVGRLINANEKLANNNKEIKIILITFCFSFCSLIKFQFSSIPPKFTTWQLFQISTLTFRILQLPIEMLHKQINHLKLCKRPRVRRNLS